MKYVKILPKKIIDLVYSMTVCTFGLLMLGNILNAIPVYGDIATSVGGSLIHIWIIIAIILCITSIICLLCNKCKLHIINFTISIISLMMCIYLVCTVTHKLAMQGAKVSVIKAFHSEDVSNIIKETIYYNDENKKSLPINIYYNETKMQKPLIIYIHGGGWITGDENNNEYTSKSLAQENYTVASIGYELSSNEKHLWNKTEKQILCGISELTKQLQPSEVFMIGDSAGGNLALNISYKINSGTYTEVNSTTLQTIKAVSVNYPVVNPEKFYNNDNVLAGYLSRKMANNYVGGPPHEFKDRYEAIAPENNITTNSPATFIILGENDSLAPPKATYEFKKFLDLNNVKNKLVRVPYCGHACDMYKNNLVNQAYIQLTIEWFNTI